MSLRKFVCPVVSMAVALGLISPTTSAEAATTIPGGNIVNQTWTAGNSPYLVQGDITVPQGAYLRVEEGAVVEFVSWDSMSSGNYPLKVELIVQGTLELKGSKSAPITLKSQGNSSMGVWAGIIVPKTATAVSVQHTVILDAVSGIETSAPGAIVSVDSSTFQNCVNGVNVKAGSPLFRGVVATDNFNGLYFSEAGGGRIENAVVLANMDKGVHIQINSGSPTIQIINATIHANQWQGVYIDSLSGASPKVAIKNTIISEAATGVQVQGQSATVEVRYSNVWGNAFSNYVGASAGVGCISENPLYKAPLSDLSLQSTSACIDAGDASDAPSIDIDGAPRPLDGDGINGAGVDMGAYEFEPVAVCGDGVVQPAEACDDGNTVDGDGCAHDCSLENTGAGGAGGGGVGGSEVPVPRGGEVNTPSACASTHAGASEKGAELGYAWLLVALFLVGSRRRAS